VTSVTLLIDKKTAGEMLGVSARTVHRMLKDGELPRVQVRGQVRIPIAAVKKIAGEGKATETARFACRRVRKDGTAPQTAHLRGGYNGDD
jgi:excisionase family DNA binding protein